MNDDAFRLLSVQRLPARLTADQVAALLNCQKHDVPALMAAGLLKPLGRPQPNAIKFFDTADVLERIKDRSWLARVTNTVYQHWQQKNASKKSEPADKAPLEEPLPMLALHG